MNELPPSDPRSEILRKIERQTFRAASIVHNLLNFTRDGAGVAEMIRVRDLVDESVALFEPQLRGRNVQLETAVEEGLPPVRGERGKLQQVLLNLLANARDAVEGGGRISVRTGHAGERVFLEVSDDGVGIAEEDLRRIFDPFFTTKGRGKGTGLGLSISYGIVREHDGAMQVESVPGEFTRFRVELPVHKPARAFA
jgi:signal transduction histidine kinase